MQYLTKKILSSRTLFDKIFFWNEFGSAERTCKRILKKRKKEDVVRLWNAAGMDYERVSAVSAILAQTLFWPNSLFCPQDETDVLLFDFDGTFGLTFFWDALHTSFNLSKELPEEDFFRRSYLEFISSVFSHTK